MNFIPTTPLHRIGVTAWQEFPSDPPHHHPSHPRLHWSPASCPSSTRLWKDGFVAPFLHELSAPRGAARHLVPNGALLEAAEPGRRDKARFQGQRWDLVYRFMWVIKMQNVGLKWKKKHPSWLLSGGGDVKDWHLSSKALFSRNKTGMLEGKELQRNVPPIHHLQNWLIYPVDLTWPTQLCKFHQWQLSSQNNTNVLMIIK